MTAEQFTLCRGLVIRSIKTGEILRVPARFVVSGMGVLPNTSLFVNKVDMDEGQYILVDGQGKTR